MSQHKSHLHINNHCSTIKLDNAFEEDHWYKQNHQGIRPSNGDDTSLQAVRTEQTSGALEHDTSVSDLDQNLKCFAISMGWQRNPIVAWQTETQHTYLRNLRSVKGFPDNGKYVFETDPNENTRDVAGVHHGCPRNSCEEIWDSCEESSHPSFTTPVPPRHPPA